MNAVPEPVDPSETVTIVFGRGVTPAGEYRPHHPIFDGYDVLRELGRGGMGVVYLARERSLDRLVALKVVTGGSFANNDAVARFQREAEAVARMQHPNIVQIFGVAAHDDAAGGGFKSPFIALEYVDGGTLARHVGRPHPAPLAAQLVETVARAVHYAHERGVVHRDLKPGNVLLHRAEVESLDRDSALPIEALSASPLTGVTPKITDFGLAKRLDPDLGHDRPTIAGTMLGTPEYMAPEQAEGEGNIGRAADIYALGVILYELLTGRVPFHGADAVDTLHSVRFDEPVPPSRLQPRLPRDLDTICMRCLHKEPARRYTSAGALADDLRAWCEGRPIAARPISTTERMTKWVRRRPAVAGLLALVVATTAAGFAGVVWQYQKASARAESERLAHAEADAARADAEANLYLARVIHAQAELEANHTTEAAELLALCVPKAGAPDYRGWEWQYLDNACRRRLLSFKAAGNDWTFDVAFSPDGTKLATATGTPYLPDAKTQPGEAAIWDTATGRRLQTFANAKGMVRRVRFSRDGRYLVTTGYDGWARLWDATTGRQVFRGWPCRTNPGDWRSNQPDAGPAWFLADGASLLICGPDQWWRVRLDDGSATPAAEFANALDVTPDGRWLLRRASERVAEVVDLRSGVMTCRIATPFIERGVISPDGRWVVITESERVEVFDAASGQVERKLSGPKSFIEAVAFSPDGQSIAAGGSDRTVFVWREGRASVAAYSGHSGEIRALMFAPDGRRLASCDMNGQVMVWDTSRDPRYQVINTQVNAAAITSIGVAPAGDGVLFTMIDNRLKTRSVADAELATVRLEGITTKMEYPRQDIAMSPDGSTVVGPCSDAPNVAGVWDAKTGVLRHRLSAHRHPVRGTCFSADGRRLATRGGFRSRDNSFEGEVIVWDAVSGQQLHVVTRQPVWGIALSPDGSLLIGADRDGQVTLWKVVTGEVMWRCSGHTNLENPKAAVIVMDAAFSPDGRTAATAGFTDGKVCLWDVARGRRLGEPLHHRPTLTGVTFTPDSRRVAAAGYDSEIRMWDVASGRPVLTLPAVVGARRADIAYTARPVFSSANEQLVMLNWTGHIVVWDGKKQAE